MMCQRKHGGYVARSSGGLHQQRIQISLIPPSKTPTTVVWIIIFHQVFLKVRSSSVNQCQWTGLISDQFNSGVVLCSLWLSLTFLYQPFHVCEKYLYRIEDFADLCSTMTSAWFSHTSKNEFFQLSAWDDLSSVYCLCSFLWQNRLCKRIGFEANWFWTR